MNFTQKNFFKVIFSSFIVLVGSYITNYVTTLLIAKHLPDYRFSQYAFTTYSIFFLANIVLFGIDYGSIKFVPAYLEANDWARLFGFLAFTKRFLLKIICYSLLLSITIIIFLFGLQSLGFSYIDKYPIVMFLWLIPIIACNIFFSKLIRSFGYVRLSLLLSFPTFSPIIMLLLMWAFSQKYFSNIFIMIILYGISAILLFLIQLYALKIILPVQQKIITPINEELIWKNNSKSILISTFIFTHLTAIGIITLKFISHNHFDVGELTVIVTICSFFLMLYNAVNLVLAPMISRQAENNTITFQRFLNAGSGFLLLFGGIWLTIITIFGHKLLIHFNKTYEAQYPILLIYAIGIYLGSSFGLSATLLKYKNHQKQMEKVSIIIVPIYIFILICLVYFLHLLGAVLAIFVIQIILMGYFSIMAKKHFGIKPFIII